MLITIRFVHYVSFRLYICLDVAALIWERKVPSRKYISTEYRNDKIWWKYIFQHGFIDTNLVSCMFDSYSKNKLSFELLVCTPHTSSLTQSSLWFFLFLSLILFTMLLLSISKSFWYNIGKFFCIELCSIFSYIVYNLL